MEPLLHVRHTFVNYCIALQLPPSYVMCKQSSSAFGKIMARPAAGHTGGWVAR